MKNFQSTTLGSMVMRQRIPALVCPAIAKFGLITNKQILNVRRIYTSLKKLLPSQ